MKNLLYDIDLEFEPQVASVHLGERKYTTPSRAIAELVANSFDAGARHVHVEVSRNELGGDDAVRVIDDGRGMTPADIRSRFARVGVRPESHTGTSQRFAKFGVGRFAAHRLGAIATWTTVAELPTGKKRSVLQLRAAQPGKVSVSEEDVEDVPTGTVAEITDLREPDSMGLTPGRISVDLAGQFFSYLIGNSDRNLYVGGVEVDVRALIERQETESIEGGDNSNRAVIRHLILRAPVDRSRFPDPVLYTAGGQTVASERPDGAISPQYLALVEWHHLESLVTSNREAIVELDPAFKWLQHEVRERVAKYQEELRSSGTALFINEVRRREYYPFKGAPRDTLANVERVMYDAVLVEVHQQVNFETMTQRQQAIVFRLLRRALENEDLLDILEELIEVPDAQLRRFRAVLSRTTIESIIKLSAEVTGRLDYLDHLHDLIYGSSGKHVLERAHLHKILEKGAWIFGEAFHLATSDQAFRSVVERHRALAGLTPVDETALESIKGVNLIPDLFLEAEKEYNQPPRHRRLLVEIKAPKVDIGKKEVDQIEKYADVIIDSPEFDAADTEWDLFLVSGDVKAEVQRRRESADRPFGMYDNNGNVRIWVFRWSEIITRAREELHLVRDHLERKKSDISLEYWAQEFPEITQSIKSRADRALKLHK